MACPGEDFFQQIHPDDRPGFRELVETSIREKVESRQTTRRASGMAAQGHFTSLLSFLSSLATR